MRRKPVLRRARASTDIDAAIDHLLDEGARSAALRFVDQLEKAFEQIAAFPATGSPRFAVELEIPGLRALPVAGFPYLVFYREDEEAIDVWRVLHTSRDIPAWLEPEREFFDPERHSPDDLSMLRSGWEEFDAAIFGSRRSRDAPPF